MWAILAGFFGGRVLRNGRTPDSVKQARWDAKVAQRQHRIDNARPWSEQWSVAWFRWTVIGLTVVLVALVLVSIFR